MDSFTHNKFIMHTHTHTLIPHLLTSCFGFDVYCFSFFFFSVHYQSAFERIVPVVTSCRGHFFVRDDPDALCPQGFLDVVGVIHPSSDRGSVCVPAPNILCGRSWERNAYQLYAHVFNATGCVVCFRAFEYRQSSLKKKNMLYIKCDFGGEGRRGDAGEGEKERDSKQRKGEEDPVCVCGRRGEKIIQTKKIIK